MVSVTMVARAMSDNDSVTTLGPAVKGEGKILVTEQMKRDTPRSSLWKLQVQKADDNPGCTTCSVEFFYNSSFPAKSWQDPASIDGEEQNKKVALLGIELTTCRSLVSHSTNCASKESVVCVNH